MDVSCCQRSYEKDVVAMWRTRFMILLEHSFNLHYTNQDQVIRKQYSGIEVDQYLKTHHNFQCGVKMRMMHHHEMSVKGSHIRIHMIEDLVMRKYREICLKDASSFCQRSDCYNTLKIL